MATLHGFPFHNMSGQSICTYKLPKGRRGFHKYGILVTRPFYGMIVHKENSVPYLQHTVQIVSVYYSCHTKFSSKTVYELVYMDGCLGVYAGIGLVTEKIAGLQSYRSGNTHPFLHTTTEFGRFLCLTACHIDLSQAGLGPVHLLRLCPLGKEIHREHHIFEHSSKIEEGCALKQHSYLLVQLLSGCKVHRGERPAVVNDLSPVRFDKAYETFEQNSLSAAAAPYHHIAPAAFHYSIDALENRLAGKTLPEILYFYHSRLIQHYFRDRKVEKENQNTADHYGLGAVAAHAHGPSCDIIPFEGGYGANEETEESRFETTVKNVEAVEAIGNALHIRGFTDDAGSLNHYPPADETEGKAEQIQQGAQDCGGKHLGLHEEGGGIHSHHIHRVNLLTDAHTTYFGGNVGPHLAGQDERYHSGTELQYETLPHHIAYIHLVYEGVFQIGRSLYNQYATYEDGYHGNYHNGGDNELVCLQYELLPIKSDIFRSAEDHSEKGKIASSLFYHFLQHHCKYSNLHSIYPIDLC